MSERRTVSREREHSTGVESTTHTSSDHTLVSRAKVADQPVQGGREPAQPLVVARLLGQEREQVAQVLTGEPQLPGLTDVPQQRLHHRQRHHLGIGDHRDDANLGAPRNMLGKALEKVIARA
jgi:hypothetical protein